MKRTRGIVNVLRQAAQDFTDDEALTRAAALSFYSALSFAPLLILMLWLAALAGNEAQAVIVEQFHDLLGPEAGAAVGAVIDNAETSPSLGSLSAVVSLIALLFSATGVFAQLQDTLNRIWEVRPKPGTGLQHFLRTRLLSLGMLAALGFLLLVSLVVSTALALVLPDEGALLRVASLVTGIAVFSATFAGIYKTVPDCTVNTRDALVGGLLTAVLFALGKEAIGLYLGRSSVGSTYGAAGSLLVLLVWVYFSSIIVLFGAELTQVYTVRYGGGIVPDEYAEATDFRALARATTGLEDPADYRELARSSFEPPTPNPNEHIAAQ